MLDTKTLLLLTLVWAVASYVIVPRLWMLYFRRHPFLVPAARLTRTGDGHPGDPVNIVLVGSATEIVRGLNAAGWFPADLQGRNGGGDPWHTDGRLAIVALRRPA